MTDSSNCGMCGHACSIGQSCNNGVCACGSGTLTCNNACVPSDSSNCGSCGHTCTTGQVCSNNACSTSCSTGQTQCGTACVVTNGNDVLN